MVLLFPRMHFQGPGFFLGYICQWPTAEEWIVNRFPQGKKQLENGHFTSFKKLGQKPFEVYSVVQKQ